MPEFIMQGRERIESESAFVQGFIEALLFTETSPAYSSADWFKPETQKAIEEGQSDGTIPGDIGAESLTDESIAFMRGICEAFQAEAGELLELAYAAGDYDEEQAGRDLLFTRCGHGVGYWERKQLERPHPERGSELGELLSEAAGHGEMLPYWDGEKLHIEGY